MSRASESFGNLRYLGRAARPVAKRPEHYPAPEATRPGQLLPPSARRAKIRQAVRAVRARQAIDPQEAELRRAELAVERADREAAELYQEIVNEQEE